MGVSYQMAISPAERALAITPSSAAAPPCGEVQAISPRGLIMSHPTGTSTATSFARRRPCAGAGEAASSSRPSSPDTAIQARLPAICADMNVRIETMVGMAMSLPVLMLLNSTKPVGTR